MKNWVQKLKLRLAAIVLLAGTVLFWGFYDRYEPAGPVLLKSPSLEQAHRVRGDCAETNGLYTLRVPASGKMARLNFRVPEATDYEHIRVRGRIKVEGVVLGKYPWSCARLIVLQYDADNKWIPGAHSVVGRDGTEDWEAHEEIFEILPETVHVDVSAQQIGASGTAWFDRIEAQPVRVRASFVWWRSIFSGVWIFMGVLYFPRCRLHERKLRTLIFLNAVAILFGSLMPEQWIEKSTDYFKEVAVQAAHTIKPVEKPVEPKASSLAKKSSKKQGHESTRMNQFNAIVGGTHRIGHFSLFASLCFLLYLCAALERQESVYYAKVGFDLLLFASITESLQFLTLDRTAGVSDLLTDIYGMAAALLLFVCVRPLVLKKSDRLA